MVPLLACSREPYVRLLQAVYVPLAEIKQRRNCSIYDKQLLSGLSKISRSKNKPLMGVCAA